MKFLDYFKMSVENLGKRKVRTFITAFAVSIGVMLIVTMLSSGIGVEKFLFSSLKELNNINRINVYNSEYQSQHEVQAKLTVADTSEASVSSLFVTKNITSDVINSISSNPKVDDMTLRYKDEVSELIIGDKTVKEMQVSSYEGDFYLSSEFKTLSEDIQKSRLIERPLNYISNGNELKTSDVASAMISEEFVKKTLEMENVEDIIGKEVVLKSIIPSVGGDKIFESKVKIIGVIDQRFYQPTLIISKDVMEQLKNFNTSTTVALSDRGVDNIELSVKEIGDVVELSSYIENELGYTVDSVQNVARTVESVFRYSKVILSILGIIVICIASLGVINTMLMSVMERTKAIGIMKATGASKRDVRNMFVVESFVIGLLGGVMGVVFSILNMTLIKGIIITLMVSYLNITDVETAMLSQCIGIDGLVAIVTLLFGVILTIMAGLYPAIKASKLDPIEAIKHE